MKIQVKRTIASLATVFALAYVCWAGEISGELKTWHKVTITFDSPETSETADPNPFTDYRLTVSGNKWRVHFAPDEVGTWKYSVSFRKGRNVAVSERENAGQGAGFMDRQTGSFDIEPTDKTGRDFRAKGRLDYVGQHYLRFAETGEYFLKCGTDAPENFLAYEDFDGPFKNDGHKDNLVKTWARVKE